MIHILEQNIEKSEVLTQQILIYFDDCLICGATWKEFLNLLEIFLAQLRIMNLKINIKKCSLGLPSIKWLGHEISTNELTSTIKNWPTQGNVHELRSLFGTMSYYCLLIPNFAT